MSRYVVLQVLGEGGMGVVLAAYDERLDRRVALKLLRQVYADNSQLEARLEREAQAMARLNHPHVVAVYDSGRLEDNTFFIVMEYVDGVTLDVWCQQNQRSWREVLGAYLDAGRGLAAAHSVGLIHRDFKPANVLVGRDGRVRVTDFGVARSMSPLLGTWKRPLTLPGHVVGTPKYLAPEMLKEQPADARSDLFSFCVALYEALYGQPPFAGATANERMRARQEGRLTPPPAKTEVPAWVGSAVMQGLIAEPEKRLASMQVLIAILQNDPEVKRRERLRVVMAVGGLVALVGLGGWVGWRWQDHGCSTMERRLVGVWDVPMKARVREMLVGTGLPYAMDTAQRVESVLDGYTGAWVKMSQEVCEATNTRAKQGRSLMALREACLERRRNQMRALTELLAERPDPGLVPKAVQAAQALPPLEYCADDKALLAAVPPPEEPALRARVEQLQQQVDQLDALFETAKLAKGLVLANKVLSEAQGVNFTPLQAKALFQVAQFQAASGNYKTAEARVREAIPLAAHEGDVLLLARAWNLLTSVMRFRQNGPQEVLGLELALETMMAQTRDDLFRADTLNNLGVALYSMGKYEESLARHERALALQEKALGPEHPLLTKSLNYLGGVLQALGKYEEALARNERALAMAEKVLGPEHPQVAMALVSQGIVFQALGKYEEALARNERALALLEKALGPEHPDVATSLNNVGVILNAMGRYKEALERYERALALQEKSLGPEHFLVARTLNNLAPVLARMGRYEEALARNERALVLLEKALGPEHPDVAALLNSVGVMLSIMGRYKEALAMHERALALIEKALGPEHPNTARSLQVLGTLHLAQHRTTQAVALLERALALTRTHDKAAVQFSLARALWESGGDKQRAMQLATQAHNQWLASKHPQQAVAAQWLASHSRP